MNPDRWKLLRELFDAAMSLAASERPEFIARSCEGNPELQSTLESLLAHSDETDSTFDQAVAHAIDLEDSIPTCLDLVGRTLGRYRILEQIGEGGMGEVYRATDSHLGREVAIKILPETFKGDPERMARFEREAKVLASLNHPGIATLHELDRADGTHFLVMELVDGKTFAERLESGPLTVQEALGLATHLAKALEVAHGHGIMHRDLKPANVMVTGEGLVKVLDFGLAKPSPAVGTEESAERTATGVVMGTSSYMSPEQARGEQVDKRTDVWAFGCVLFELLTKRRAFGGDSATEVLAAVMEREPEWHDLPEETPALVGSLLRRCLKKETKNRLHDIADARIELEEAQEGLPEDCTLVSLPRAGRDRRQKLLWAAGGLLAGALLISTVDLLMTRSTPPAAHDPLRFNISPSPDGPIQAWSSSGKIALSPDGRRLVYLGGYGVEEGRLFLRPMNQVESTQIEGTEGAHTPFFSPDGDWIGFYLDSKVQKISLEDGQSITICEGASGGASWGEDDTILFGTREGGLSQVSSNGGEPQVVTSIGTATYGRHRWPQILPGGRAALFTIDSKSHRHEDFQIAVVSIETGEWRVLLEGGGMARYVPSGHVIYSRLGSLLAVPFDLKTLEVTGRALPVLEDVAMHPVGAAFFGVSRAGSLAYIRRPYSRPNRSLAWIDRQGKATLVPGQRRAFSFPRLSPDGERMAVDIGRSDGRDLWVYEFSQQTWSRITFAGHNGMAQWSPDGEWLAFKSNRDGPNNLFRILADGSGTPERLRTSQYFEHPMDWSNDGRLLLFNQQRSGRSFDLWILPLDERDEARPYVATEFLESVGSFSPDGQWVVMHSKESGQFEVYVRSFPDPGRKWTISRNGGFFPLWSPAGGELFFKSLDMKRMMVASVQTEPTFRAETPRVLFETEIPMLSLDIAQDGQSFIAVLKDAEEREPEQIVVIPNFAEELEAKFREAGR